MARSGRPLAAIVSLALLGALLGALARYAWAMYRFSAAGEDTGAVPFGQLAIDVMQLHVYALYGAAAGAALGLAVVLVDLVFFRPRRRYDWSKREVTADGADTIIKQRRAQRAEAYLEQRRRERDGKEQ
ncbi:MAG: hypothetical protein R3286_08325 [Gammaproteobacteria bacterium]|nr:hypothetical protein [Gammaproteobacteria bacterium]